MMDMPSMFALLDAARGRARGSEEGPPELMSWASSIADDIERAETPPWWSLDRYWMSKAAKAARLDSFLAIGRLEMMASALDIADRVARREWEPGELAELFEAAPTRLAAVEMVRRVALRVCDAGPPPEEVRESPGWGPQELAAALMVREARELGGASMSFTEDDASHFHAVAVLLNRELEAGALSRFVAEKEAAALGAMDLGGQAGAASRSKSL